MKAERDSRKLIQLLKADGWVLARVKGSHHVFVHPAKPGLVVLPHPRHELAFGTAKSVLRQAGLLETEGN